MSLVRVFAGSFFLVALGACSGQVAAPVTETITVAPSDSPSAEAAQSSSPPPSPSTASATASPSPTETEPPVPVTAKVKVADVISPYGSFAADEFIKLEITFVNVADKQITAITGKVLLTDPLGRTAFTGQWEATGLRLAPGDSYEQSNQGYTIRGSTGYPGCAGGTAYLYGLEDLCRALGLKFKDYKWTFEPGYVKFKGGDSWT